MRPVVLAPPNPAKVDIIGNGIMGFSSGILSNFGRVFFCSLFLATDAFNIGLNCFVAGVPFIASGGSRLEASEAIVGNCTTAWGLGGKIGDR